MPSAKCCESAVSYLPDRVRIEKDVSVISSPIPSYSTLYSSVPCRIEPSNGDEHFRGQQLEAHQKYSVVLRYVTGLTPRMRIIATSGIYSGKILNIGGVVPIQEQGKAPILHLNCEELVPV